MEQNFISQAVKINLSHIITYLRKSQNFFLASNIVEMLKFLNFTRKDLSTDVELTLKLTRAVLHYFDMCIIENGKKKITF